MKNKKLDWEKEFEKRFWDAYQEDELQYSDVKSFISSLLDKQRTELEQQKVKVVWNSVCEQIKQEARTELLEEIKNYFRYKRFGCTDESGKIMADFVLDVVKQEVINLLNKKDE